VSALKGLGMLQAVGWGGYEAGQLVNCRDLLLVVKELWEIVIFVYFYILFNYFIDMC